MRIFVKMAFFEIQHMLKGEQGYSGDRGKKCPLTSLYPLPIMIHFLKNNLRSGVTKSHVEKIEIVMGGGVIIYVSIGPLVWMFFSRDLDRKINHT